MRATRALIRPAGFSPAREKGSVRPYAAAARFS